MTDIIQRIYDFNTDAGLLDKPYNDRLEASFQIEEALEGFDITKLSLRLGGTILTTPKTLARELVAECVGTVSEVDALDKAIDAVVFAIGGVAKLGLTPTQCSEAINIVMDANLAKLNCPKDSHGKLTKPLDFQNPEPLLQEILDARTIN